MLKSSVRTLQLDLILNHEGLAGVIDGGREFGRDGVMSGFIFQDETFVAGDSLEDARLLDRPSANVRPLFLGRLVVDLLSVRRLPS